MDILDENTISYSDDINNKNGFIQHVFNFDTNTKGELFNIIQYACLAIIPIIIMNKLIKNYIPEADYRKDTLEIVIEVFGQLILLLGGIFFIHRIITYIPTYSGIAYQQINFINMILVFLVIILSLQTKLGEKVEILFERVMDLWNGGYRQENEKIYNKHDKIQREREQEKYPVMNYYSEQSQEQRPKNNTPLPPTIPTQERKPDMEMNYNIGQEQINTQTLDDRQTQVQPQSQPQPQPQQQQNMNFDQMYQEPMAANDALGGGFGTAF